jgi:type II secretory pathway pseudopilin PulG
MTKNSQGFTFIELLIYISIVATMMTAIIPFAWNVIGSSSKSSTEQDVFSQARFVSERIKYEIRNSLGINSVTSTQLVLCETNGSCATNPTTITFSSPNITIADKGAAAVNLNSTDTTISGFTFTNYTSSDNKTKHIGFTFTVSDSSTESTLDFVEGCTEDTLSKIRADSTLSGTFTITRPEGTCSVTVVSTVGVTWTVNVTTQDTVYNRTIQVIFNRNPTGITLTSWKEV